MDRAGAATTTLPRGANVTGEELSSFCKDRLARYKIPKSVDFLEALPMNATGKVLKTELRARCGQGGG